MDMSEQVYGVPLWSAPLPEEPAHGLVMRLAEINGYPTLQSVLDVTGLTIAGLHRGEKLDRLATIVRCPVAMIAADSFILENEVDVALRDHRLNFKHDYALQSRRACPACLRESPHHRFMWDLRFVTSCPRHGIKLVDTCACGSGRKLGWKDHRVYRGRCCNRGDLRTLEGEPADPDVVAMDAYFAGRFGVGPAVSVPGLDELALCDAIEVLDRVGALAVEGYSTKWQKSRKARAFGSPAMATAYRIIAEGRLQETLDVVFEGYLANPDRKPASLTSAYGWFYHWYNLRGNQRFSRFLTEEIYLHAATRFRIDRKAMRNKSIAVSQPVIDRMNAFDRGRQTLSAAAAYCGCHQVHLRKLATAYGLMRAEKLVGRVVLFEPGDVEVLKILVERAVFRREVMDLLNVAPRFVNRLEEEGALIPVLKAGRDGLRVSTFLADDVIEILDVFETSCVRGEDDGHPSISAKHLIAYYNISAIISAVRAGDVSPLLCDRTALGMERYRFRRADLAPYRRNVVAHRAPTSAVRTFVELKERLAQVETDFQRQRRMGPARRRPATAAKSVAAAASSPGRYERVA